MKDHYRELICSMPAPCNSCIHRDDIEGASGFVCNDCIHTNNPQPCKHCAFLESIFKPISEMEDKTNREYWIYTEMFVYLHKGKDYCDKETK